MPVHLPMKESCPWLSMISALPSFRLAGGELPLSRRCALLTCLLLSLCLPYAPFTSAAPHAPISLHPDNPHYFLWRDKPTVLVTSAEHYGAVVNLDFDYERYLGELQKQGLNLTRTFSGFYVELPDAFGITDNPLSPAGRRFITPWARHGELETHRWGAKFDLTAWDRAYFDRLKDFIAKASAAGIVVEYTLFCTLYDDESWAIAPMQAENNINGVGTCARAEVFSLQNDDVTAAQVALTRKVVQELQGFDNLIYEVCNEPYEGCCVGMEWQQRIVDTIVEEETKLGVRHMISMNIANGKAKVDAPLEGVKILNFHYAYPPEAVTMNFGLSRLIGDNETGFRGRGDFAYRREGWSFLLAGGGLFNNLDWSFTPSHPEGDLVDFASPGGGGPTIRGQIALLKKYLEGFDFVRMAPSAALATTLPGDLHTQVLAEPGVAYAIYLGMSNEAAASGTPIVANIALDLLQGDYTVEWLDPKTGEVTAGLPVKHGGGVYPLESPQFIEDIALSIRRSSGP